MNFTITDAGCSEFVEALTQPLQLAIAKRLHPIAVHPSKLDSIDIHV
ncbi:hypothetical protein PN498_15260 [Oscillatoria sp. CS-180]|nr:hypothetical protein [Oscillatoria sp. CS-180]MDB9527357.1 hypothetical protein [Oscillatoria sp. CS-180]